VVSQRSDFSTNEMKPNKVTAVGEVKIIDSKNFPETQALHLTQPAVTLHIKALEAWERRSSDLRLAKNSQEREPKLMPPTLPLAPVLLTFETD